MQQTTWLPVKDAAQRLGVSADTVKRRIKAGALEARQEPTAQGYRWLVAIGAPETPPAGGAAEIAQLRAEAERLRGLLAEIAAERDYLRTALLGSLARLPQIAERASQRPAWWRFWR